MCCGRTEPAQRNRTRGAQALRDEAGTLAIRTSVPIPYSTWALRQAQGTAQRCVRRGATRRKRCRGVHQQRCGAGWAQSRCAGAEDQVQCGAAVQGGAVLLGCWLVVPCGAMRRKRRAARGCDSSGQAQGSCGGNASVCQLDPSRKCAGFRQAPSLLGAKEMAGVGDEVPGNPPVHPVPARSRCRAGRAARGQA